MLELVPGDDHHDAGGVLDGGGVVGGGHEMALLASLLVDVANSLVEEVLPVIAAVDGTLEELE